MKEARPARHRQRHSSSLQEVSRALSRHKSFLLAAHVRPEGDSVGSLLALKELLRRLKKKCWIVNEDPFPERLGLLPRNGWHTAREIARRKNKPVFDAAIVVDCPRPGRMGAVEALIHPDTVLINIDHHVSNSFFGTHNLVRANASACGELVYELFEKMRVPLSKQAALPLYVSVSTDTGSFRNSNTSSRTHEIAARLIRTGINVEKINEALYERASRPRVRLLADLLSRMHLTMGGSIAWGALPKSLLRRSGASQEDTEGLIDYLRFVQNVKIAFLITEMAPREWNCYLRAKGSCDVSRIAESLGGGGHRKAAGCTLRGEASHVAKRLLAVIRSTLNGASIL